MCCKSYFVCCSLFLAILFSPALIQAQTANQTKAEAPTVKVEKLVLDTQIAEVETNVPATTATQKCKKAAICPPNCPPCPTTCPPNCPPSQCKPKACSKSKASAAQTSAQSEVIEM